MVYINILILLYIYYIFTNFKKGLILFLILTPITNNPALYAINIKYIPLMTFWRLLYLFIIMKYFLKFYYNKKYWINNKYPLLNNFKMIIITVFISFIMNGFIGIGNLISIILEQVLLFFIIWDSLEKKDDILTVFKGLFFIFFIITLYGLYCKITNSNPYHREILSAITESGYRKIEFGEYSNRIRVGLNQRVASFMYNPISYGGHLGMIFPFVLAFLKFSKNPKKCFYYILVLLIIINGIIINSRSAIIILFFSSIFYYNFQSINMKLRFLLIFSIVLFVIFFYPELFGPYFINIKSIINISSEYDEIGGTTLRDRMLMFKSFIDFIKTSPFFGHGPTSLDRILERGPGYNYMLGGENYSLCLIFQYGLLGFFAYLLYWYNIFVNYKYLKNTCNNVFQKKIAVAGIAMLLSWIIFVNVTGAVNVIIFLTILIALSLKFCSGYFR